jgi:hypothetical protein
VIVELLLESWRQLVDKSVFINATEKLGVIILQEGLHLIVKVLIKLSLLCEFFEGSELADEILLLTAFRSNDRGKGTNHKGIESYTQKHPDASDQDLPAVVCSKITIAYSC